MRDEIYCYSKELQEPDGVIDCNRDDPKIALQELKNIRWAKQEVRTYIPPEDVEKSIIRYPSSDGTQIECYVLKSRNVLTGKQPCVMYYHGGGLYDAPAAHDAL